MTREQVYTGEIIPRDYGLLTDIRSSGSKIFFSPGKYALATLMIETPSQIRERIVERSNTTGETPKDLESKLTKGVLKKEGTKNVLNRSLRDVLREVKKYGGNRYTAEIPSKSEDDEYVVMLCNPITNGTELKYIDTDCTCKDSFWDNAKKSKIMCVHMCALELALYLDHHTGKSVRENITGLYPRERTESPSLPFDFYSGNKESFERKQNLITDAIFEYYVGKKGFFEIGRNMLDDNIILGTELKNYLFRGIARYSVIRGSEKIINNPTPADSILYPSLKALESKIIEKIIKSGFIRNGYSLEFKGSNIETIVQRFERKNKSYSLAIKENQLPFMVYREILPEQSADSIDYKNIIDEFGTKKNIPKEFISVDDSTRRKTKTRIIFPDEFGLFLSKVLQKRFNRDTIIEK